MQNSTLLLRLENNNNKILSEPLIAEDGHDSRDNLAVNPNSSAVFDPLVEDLVIIEELCDDKVSSSIDLFLKVANIIITGLCLKVLFWVACYTDAEIVTILFPDETNQVDRIVETIFNGNPVGLASGWITSQGKQIADAQLFGLSRISFKMTYSVK